MDWWTKLEAHPAASVFPRMVDSELQSLADNINTNGQIFPIVLTKEKPSRTVNGEEVPGEPQRILDGRNRLAAYLMLKKRGIELEPHIETYAGSLSPRDYVRSVNWERMHLTREQRLELMGRMLPKAREEARVRQAIAGTANLRGSESGSSDLNCKSTPEVDAVKGSTAEVIGKALGLSPTTVKRAAKVQKTDASAFEKITQGISTVNAEYDKLPKKEKTPPKSKSAAKTSKAETPGQARTKQKKEEDAQITNALDTIFRSISSFEDGLRELKLGIRELPKLDDDRRGRYLGAAMQLQTQLNLLIAKLQEAPKVK